MKKNTDMFGKIYAKLASQKAVVGKCAAQFENPVSRLLEKISCLSFRDDFFPSTGIREDWPVIPGAQGGLRDWTEQWCRTNPGLAAGKDGAEAALRDLGGYMTKALQKFTPALALEELYKQERSAPVAVDNRMPSQKNPATVRRDLLGEYHPVAGKPNVLLYWVPIAVLAREWQWSVAGLTAVVLAHELAHAITHVGCDLDRRDWDTRSYCITESALHEFFAQYYAYRVTGFKKSPPFDKPATSVCRQIITELSKQQPEIYRAGIEDSWPAEMMRSGLMRGRESKGKLSLSALNISNLAEII